MVLLHKGQFGIFESHRVMHSMQKLFLQHLVMVFVSISL
jgi:hypothetical protein